MRNGFPRLAILSSRFPFPVEKGDKLRLYHQIKYLAEYYDIYLFALSDAVVSKDDYREINQFCKGIFVYVEKKYKKRLRVFSRYFDSRPSQVNYFYSKDVERKLWTELSGVNPDVVYCQLFRMAPYVDVLRAPKVLDIMDSFANIAHLQSENSRSFIERSFWARESVLLARYEEHLKNSFSAFTIISERDARSLSRLGQSTVHIIRNGIDVDFFGNYEYSANKDTFDVSFIGNLEYRPNQEAAMFLIARLWPYFKSRGITLKILIGGKGAEKLGKNVKSKNVYFHGWYEDIRDAYYSAPVFMAPIFLGSGMQNKVLEALACSRKVICSSHVMEAMPMLKDLVSVADTLEAYYDLYVDALQKTEVGEKKQNSIINVLKETLTWENQCGKLKKVIEDARENYQWDNDRYH